MPHIPFANKPASEHDDAQDLGLKLPEHEPRKRKNSVLGRSIQKIGNWFKDDEPPVNELLPREEEHQEGAVEPSEEQPTRRPSLLGRRGNRRVVPELPRPLTFRRQNSERRERLLPVPVEPERRAVSADRRPRAISRARSRSPPLIPLPSVSAPEVGTPIRHPTFEAADIPSGDLDLEDSAWPEQELQEPPNLPQLDGLSPILDDDDGHSDVLDERELQAELESKWILNLSMHFRDKSDREKFFVTYAQEPNRWRRVTVSLDYRDAEPDSLEADLKTLHYQRDKSTRIYEAVRESLPDIQFFDTVTNLKLQTDEGRLHVHVTEDVNEIISYPTTSLVEHVECKRYRESELEFDAHLSGFVYRVRVGDQVLIKKEIPGPETVDEFLYEINALDALQDSRSVIKFHGLVIDENCSLVKGLLISFASRGSLIDMLYDFKDTDQLPWESRQRWAYQIVEGLSEIHEAGFVQGDFTLSNIVIDGNDDAKIIDINRRGCPVGWEPPELISLIHSGQRISMCIGVKSDLYQLGMVLWALSEKNDEPENVERVDDRLPPPADEETPLWFRRIVETCLSERPRDRVSAKELLCRFPPLALEAGEIRESGDLKLSDHSIRSRRSDKHYIDPAAAVRLEDIEEYRRERLQGQDTIPCSHHTSEPYTFVNASTNYRDQSDGSYIIPDMGAREIPRQRRRSPPYDPVLSSATSMSSRNENESRPRRRTYEYLCPDDDDEEAALSTSGRGNGVSPAETRHQEYSEEPPSITYDSSRRRAGPPAKNTRFASERGSSPSTQYNEDHDMTARQLRRQEGAYFSPPLHQDSGFDEHMIAGFELPQNPTATSAPAGVHKWEECDLENGRMHLDTASPLSATPIQSHLSECQTQSHVMTEQPTMDIASEPILGLSTQSGQLSATIASVTPLSPPEPGTPFSYHTPLTTPLNEAETHDNSQLNRPEATEKPAYAQTIQQ